MQQRDSIIRHLPVAVVEHSLLALPDISSKQQKCGYSPYCTKRRGDIILPQIHKPDKSRSMEVSLGSPDLRVIVYETLEQKRANKIGVKPLRNFDVTRSKPVAKHSLPPIESCTPVAPQLQFLQSQNEAAVGKSRNNSIAPFTTMSPKPTCGYYFNRETVNKKVRIGVPPSDLVKWRSDYSQFPQKQA